MRKFIVLSVSKRGEKTPTGFAVTDAKDADEFNNRQWPEVARFPISQRWDEDTQEQLAKDVAEYLNQTRGA